MNPLLSLGTLSAHVEHSECQVLNNKGGFRNASRFDTRSKDVLVVGEVVVGRNSVNRIKIAINVSG